MGTRTGTRAGAGGLGGVEEGLLFVREMELEFSDFELKTFVLFTSPRGAHRDLAQVLFEELEVLLEDVVLHLGVVVVIELDLHPEHGLSQFGLFEGQFLPLPLEHLLLFLDLPLL